MAKIIQFPTSKADENIDWEFVCHIRNVHYPLTPDSFLEFLESFTGRRKKVAGDFVPASYDEHIYPPKSIKIYPNSRAMIWIIDLFDRYGGKISHRNHQVGIVRGDEEIFA